MRLTITFAIALALGTGLMAQDDLAKYQEHMKAAAAANGAVGKAVTENDTAAIKANAATASASFDWIATFFEGKGKADGAKFAKDASAAFKELGAATTPDDMKAARAKIGPNCSGCHMLYRAGSAFKGL